jgi:DNA-directed RNA polymerase specialized sigma24 family protein
MNTDSKSDRNVAEGRFVEVFAHLDFIVQYGRHRGARDPDGIAAEAMAIAWRRLADVPTDDPRPWLIVTTRNLLLAEHRREPNNRTQPLGEAGRVSRRFRIEDDLSSGQENLHRCHDPGSIRRS